MAIVKSKYTGGMGRKQLPSPYVANQPVTLIVSHEFTAGLLAADTLELAALPPNCKITQADLMTEGTAAITFGVGFMSGEFGSSDPARTNGTELFAAATPTTMQSTGLAALANLAVSESARSIGVRCSANVAANAATKLHLRLTYLTGQS